MKMLSRTIKTIGVSFALVFAACTPDAPDSTINPEPNPDDKPTPEPPVESVEQRMVSKIQVTSDDAYFIDDVQITFYFNYDDKNRVEERTTIYTNEYGSDWWVLDSFDYVAQDLGLIKFTQVDVDNDYTWRENIYLNDKGYVELYEGYTYTYDANGYLVGGVWGDGLSTTTYRWRDGNLMSIEEKYSYVANEFNRYMTTLQYDTNNANLVNIDIADFLLGYLWEMETLSLCLLPTGLTGQRSKNYITSFTERYDSSQNDSGTFRGTLRWSFDDDGYPKVCLINCENDEREEMILVEISYIDETGEITPPIQAPEITEPITLSANRDVIELGESVEFTVTQAGKDVTASSVIYNLDPYAEVSNPFTPTKTGEYSFYAENGSERSEAISVTVTESSSTLPNKYQRWIGTYIATTYQVLVYDENGITLEDLDDSEQDFTVTIDYNAEGEWFEVTGLSAQLPNAPVIALLDEDDNLCLVETTFLDDDADGVYMVWRYAHTYWEAGIENIVWDDDVTPYRFSMDASGNITCNIAVNEIDGIEYTGLSAEVFEYDENKPSLNFLVKTPPIVLYAGKIDLVKVSNSVSSASLSNRSASVSMQPRATENAWERQSRPAPICAIASPSLPTSQSRCRVARTAP